VSTTAGDGAMLIAYVVPAAGGTVTARDLRAFVADALPAYMVPSRFETVGSLPLRSNGKLDRDRLPAVRTPRNVLRRSSPDPWWVRAVGEAWEAAVGSPATSIDEDFFDAGGDSLVAARLTGLLREATGLALDPGAVFRGRTVRELAVLAADCAGVDTSCRFR
jgi:hypothetical protein